MPGMHWAEFRTLAEFPGETACCDDQRGPPSRDIRCQVAGTKLNRGHGLAVATDDGCCNCAGVPLQFPVADRGIGWHGSSGALQAPAPGLSLWKACTA